jgi:hypothetical protein
MIVAHIRKNRIAYKRLARKPERTGDKDDKCKWEDNIKMDFN